MRRERERGGGGEAHRGAASALRAEERLTAGRTASRTAATTSMAATAAVENFGSLSP